MDRQLETYSMIIVDDEEMIRNGLRRFGNWEALGFCVAAVFEDGKDAFEYLCQHPVDVVLTDIRMAELSGLDLSERLLSEGIDTHVVIMSGYRDFEYARRAVASHAFDYLLKPIEMESLADTFQRLHTYIGQKQEQRQQEETPPSPKGISSREFAEKAVRKVKIWIEQEYMRDISLEEAASLVCLSPVYFCKVFKEVNGQTFLQYLTAVRIEKARQLLEGRQHKVSEISSMVGYRNMKYFTKVFKKHCGLTPTDYQRRAVLCEQ